MYSPLLEQDVVDGERVGDAPELESQFGFSVQ